MGGANGKKKKKLREPIDLQKQCKLRGLQRDLIRWVGARRIGDCQHLCIPNAQLAQRQDRHGSQQLCAPQSLALNQVKMVRCYEEHSDMPEARSELDEIK